MFDIRGAMNTSRIQTIRATYGLEESSLAEAMTMAGAVLYCVLFFKPELGSAFNAMAAIGICGALLAGMAACGLFVGRR